MFVFKNFTNFLQYALDALFWMHDHLIDINYLILRFDTHGTIRTKQYETENKSSPFPIPPPPTLCCGIYYFAVAKSERFKKRR